MKSNSLYQYGGTWYPSILQLNQAIAPTDTIIYCATVIDSNWTFSLGDLITLRIKNVFYTVRWFLDGVQFGFEIIQSLGTRDNVLQSETVSFLKSIIASAPEDLPSFQQVHELSEQLNIAWSYFLIPDITNKTNDLYDFSSVGFDSNYMFEFFLYEVIPNGTTNIIERSEVEWTMNVSTGIFTWTSITNVPSAIGVLSFYRKGENVNGIQSTITNSIFKDTDGKYKVNTNTSIGKKLL